MMSSYELLFGSSSSESSDDEEVFSEFVEFVEFAEFAWDEYQASLPKVRRTRVARDHHGAHNRLVGRKKSKASETTSGSTNGGLNLHNVDDSEEEETRESRTVGRDQSKKKSSASSREAPPSFVSSSAEKYFNFKPTKSGKKKEITKDYIKLRKQEMERKEARSRRQEELQMQKIELQRRQIELMEQTKRDQDIIFYNSAIDPNLPPRQQRELMDMKASIKQMYNLDY